MNKRSTRWFALLLAVAMVFSILPTAVFAEGKTQTYTKSRPRRRTGRVPI